MNLIGGLPEKPRHGAIALRLPELDPVPVRIERCHFRAERIRRGFARDGDDTVGLQHLEVLGQVVGFDEDRPRRVGVRLDPGPQDLLRVGRSEDDLGRRILRRHGGVCEPIPTGRSGCSQLADTLSP